MAILVTGGTGYIGSHTAVELLNAGFDVVVADNLSNSREEVLDRIAAICGRRPAFYRVDVRDKAALSALFNENNIEAAIHFAGFKAVGESCHVPLRYYRNNLDAALTLAEVMAHAGCRRLVFSSSATVYGPDNPYPYTEEMEAIKSTSPYGWTKVMIERVLRDLCTADDTWSVVSLRYFNPIGSHPSGLIGDDPNGIPNNLMPYIGRVAAGTLKQLTIFGDDYATPDGTCQRDYIHVVDLARGHLSALRYAGAHRGFIPINLGTGRGTSVRELVETFERVTGVPVPHAVGPRRDGDLPAFWASADRAKRLLNWQAGLTLEDMCRDSWRFYKNCAVQ